METLKQQCIFCGEIIEGKDSDELFDNMMYHKLNHTLKRRGTRGSFGSPLFLPLVHTQEVKNGYD